MLLAILLLSLAAEGGQQRIGGRLYGRQRAAQRGTPVDSVFFEFAPSNFAGLQLSPPNICDTLTGAEKSAGEYWCINGATPAADSTVTMTRQATAFEEVTVKQCTGGPNCYDMVGLRATQPQSGGGGPFFKSAVLSDRNTTTVSPFTACAWTRHSAFENMFIGLGDENSQNTARYRLGSAGVRTQYADMSNATCGTAISRLSSWGPTTPWTTDAMGIEDGLPILVCIRYDGTNVVHRSTYWPSTGSAVAAHCAGGTNARYLYGGLSTVSSDGTLLTQDAYLFGGFHVSTALSDSRILEISSAMFGNTVRSKGGIAVTNPRSTQEWCESADGQHLTGLPPGYSCMTGGGLYKRRESTNYWKISHYLGAGNGFGYTGTTATNNARVSPDGTKNASTLAFSAGTAYLSRTYANGTCPAGASVLSYYVKGTTSDGTIRAGVLQAGSGVLDACSAPCSYTTSNATRCKFPVTNSRADNEFWIGQFTGAGANCSTATTNTANTVVVWGIQCEADVGGGLATPLIPTAGDVRLHGADKPYFAVPTTNTAPLSMRAKWTAPPVSINLGDTAGISGYPPYLVALEFAGAVRNYLRFLWYTAEYSDGSSAPLNLALELTADTGDIKFRGQTDGAFNSGATLGLDSIGPYLGGGSARTFDTVNIGWSSVNLNFDGVIKEVCVDTKETGCQ